MSHATYGVLLVSFSKHSHQRSFVPLFQGNPRTRIVAVADETDIEPYLKDWNRTWAEALGVPYIEDVQMAIERSDVDIVSIGHEIERRADLIKRSAEAGKHLWIDKFLGASLDECDAVVDAVQRSGVTSIIPGYTYGELVHRGREILQSGALGALMGVHADLMFAKGAPQPFDEQDIQRPFLPAGRWKFPDIKRELLTVGAYAVALVQRCLGTVTSVWGQGDAYFFPEHANHGAEDFATLSMTDESGRLATISGTRTGVASHHAGGLNRAYLVGSKGTAQVDATRPALEVYLREETIHANYQVPDDDPMQWATRAPGLSDSVAVNPLARGLDDLVAALDEERPTQYPVEDARQHMEILLAGYRSIETGKVVALPLKRGTST